MRTVNEWPGSGSKYPWDKIEAAVDAGEIVALEAEEYGRAATSISSAIRGHIRIHNLSWQVMVRGSSVFVRKARR